jgi:3-oxoacyl-[acyl-carrier protein] reductase
MSAPIRPIAPPETSSVRPSPPRVAVVTGGTRGIGRAVVEALAQEGWNVVTSGSRPASVDEARRTFAPLGDRVTVEVADGRDAVSSDRLAEAALSRWGRLDAWINNAGLGRFGPVDQLTDEQWHEVLRTNLDGAFFGIRAAARAMKPRGGGWILNVASLASKNPFAGGAAYNASKFGLLGLSEAAMLDLRHDGIRIASVLPGSVDTDFGHRGGGADWMLRSEDVAEVILDLLRFPDRALPSLVEIRPSRPPKK